MFTVLPRLSACECSVELVVAALVVVVLTVVGDIREHRQTAGLRTSARLFFNHFVLNFFRTPVR